MQPRNVQALVIVLLILIIGGYLVAKNRKPAAVTTSPTPTITSTVSPVTQSSSGASSQTSANQSASQYIVTFTSGGFSPSTITVPKGATVMFQNNSGQGMWVASNPHPSHTDYPGFDALKTYADGETYSFTFTKTGSWGYHNHLNPSAGGTVVVQ